MFFGKVPDESCPGNGPLTLEFTGTTDFIDVYSAT